MHFDILNLGPTIGYPDAANPLPATRCVCGEQAGHLDVLEDPAFMVDCAGCE